MRKIEFSLIVVVAIFTATVLPIFKEDHVMELGSTSDILSAFCNVAMAGAALYAASKAKDWFNQKKLNIGFDQAILNLAEYDKLKVQLDVFHTNLIIDSKRFEVSKLYDIYNGELEKLRPSLLAFVRSISNNKRFGFELKVEIKQQIVDSLPLYINLIYKIFAIKDLPDHMKMFNDLIRTKESQLSELEALYAETNKLSTMLTKDIEEIFDFKSR